MLNQDLEYPYEVIVIDSGSTDGSIEMIREKFPDVRLIVDPVRASLNQKLNLAIELTKGKDYVAFLNNDIRLQPNYLSVLIDFIEKHPDAGVVGPLIQDNHGNIYNGGNFRFNLGKFSPIFFPDNAQVTYVSGTAFFFRRKALENVRFDERIFFTSDVAICLTLATKGYSCYVTNSTVVFHDSHATVSPKKLKGRMKTLYFHGNKDTMLLLRQFKPIYIPVLVMHAFKRAFLLTMAGLVHRNLERFSEAVDVLSGLVATEKSILIKK